MTRTSLTILASIKRTGKDYEKKKGRSSSRRSAGKQLGREAVMRGVAIIRIARTMWRLDEMVKSA